MKVKFNLFERVAGLFVLGALGGAVAASVSVAYKKGWFSSKVPFHATFSSAEGLHVGTKVQISGLRAGSVTDVELLSDNSVRVRFVVLEKFHGKIKQNSVVQLVRPFVIGEKVMDIGVGDKDAVIAKRGSELTVVDSLDLMELISGKQLGGYLKSMSQLTENLKVLMDAFSDKKRFKALIDTLDDINHLVRNMNEMSKNVTQLSRSLNRDKKVSRLIGSLAIATDELKPHFSDIAKYGPAVAVNMAKSLEDLVLITHEMKKVLPAVAAVAPDLPRTSKRLVEAVDEAVVMMKALQRSWIIKSHAEDIRSEESKRKPASD
ncbi:multidrug ABC transporter substrate-binding protein [Candidatus Kaiserbacteria bacterium]|nr:MAG: multidrug ABC transporter substrate-binding protein [Candidatus Kaiserbacteria bacterium]